MQSFIRDWRHAQSKPTVNFASGSKRNTAH
jgi:hypothetical protein